MLVETMSLNDLNVRKAMYHRVHVYIDVCFGGSTFRPLKFRTHNLELTISHRNDQTTITNIFASL